MAKKNMGMKWLNSVMMFLLVAGGLNWGLVALFNFDLVTFLSFGVTFIDILVKSLVGLAGLYGFWLIAREWV